jgi:hypothetical protein
MLKGTEKRKGIVTKIKQKKRNNRITRRFRNRNAG